MANCTNKVSRSTSDNLFTEDLCYTTASLALMQSGYLKDRVMVAIRHFVCKNGHTDFTAEDLLKILLQTNLESNNNRTSDVETLTAFLQDIEFDGQLMGPALTKTVFFHKPDLSGDHK